MSYTDLRDFEPEYTTIVDHGHGHWTVEVEKLGGGTVGKSYTGTWRYRVTNGWMRSTPWATRPDGHLIAEGQDLTTGTPKMHAEVAKIVADLLAEDSS